MDRSWMYADRREREYVDGVKEFCNAALEHKRVTDEQSIFCPCRDCGNLKRWVDIKKIEEHLFRRGFTPSYETWLWHGERIDRQNIDVCGDDNHEVANHGCDKVYERQITEQEWKMFEDYVTSDADFQEKRKKGKKNAEGNIHRHTMGQKSYERKRPEWISQNRLPHYSTDSAESSSVVDNRALEWCLAHQKSTKDGWAVDPARPDTVRVVNQMGYLEQEAKEREKGLTSTSSEYGVDALTKALGKRDHPGYVKVLGRSGAFGKAPRRFSQPRHDDYEERMQAKVVEMEARVEARLRAEFEERIQDIVASIRSEPQMTVASMARPTPFSQPPFVSADTKKCRLAVANVDIPENLIVVAEGTAFLKATKIHNSILLPDHYKVSIDMLIDDQFHSIPLPVASPDGTTKIGDAKGSFVQWPRHMIIFDDEEQKLNRSIKKSFVDSCSQPRTEDVQAAVREKMFGGIPTEDLGEECQMLCFVLHEDPSRDTFALPLDKPRFYLKEDSVAWIDLKDIRELLVRSEVSVSVIEVYILFLCRTFLDSIEGSNITFMWPDMFSGAQCHADFTGVISYVKDVFKAEAMKGDQQCRYVLAPYVEDFHWVLLTIDLRKGVVYLFDSLIRDPKNPRELSCKNNLQYAYMGYKAFSKKGGKKKLEYRDVQCAQQHNSVDCGYYVMRFMYEIVTLHREHDGDLVQEYNKFDAYTDEEVNEVREQWASFFRSNILLD